MSKSERQALEKVVAQLPAETVQRVIRHYGLDACAELVAAATPAQLAEVLDVDLWHGPRAGRDDVRFDADRFLEWVEHLVDADEALAARITATLDPRLVVAGLSRHIAVFDAVACLPLGSTDDEPFESSLGRARDADGPVREVGRYVVRGRRADGWDAIVLLLEVLRDDHEACFHAIMRGCRALSDGEREVDGLDALLMESDQWLHDLGAARHDRRTEQGYVAIPDARAFLALARRGRTERTHAAPSIQPAGEPDVASILAASFRSGTPAALPAPIDPALVERLRIVCPQLVDPGDFGDASVPARGPRALLGAAATRGDGHLASLHALMDRLRADDEPAYLACGEELAVLANVLVSGCSLQGRPMTAQEAADVAGAVCNLALEPFGPATPHAGLTHRSLVDLFQDGWAMLYRDVSLLVARGLIATLRDVGKGTETHAELRALRRRAVTLHDAGTPWLLRDALDPIATLDPLAWTALLGLLSECPVIPEALTAILERRRGTVSPTAFAFISTARQIEEVRTFLDRLPGLLA